MDKAQIGSLVRHVLIFVAGVAAARIGLAQPVTELIASQPVNDFVVFLVTVAVPTVWSAWRNSKQKKHVDVALALPAGSTPEMLKEQLKYLAGKK